MITSDIIPNGIDWADGLNSHPGTATPAAAVVTRPLVTTGGLEEDPGSPEIERGEQCTIRHTFRTDYVSGLVYLNALGRGAFMQDDTGNVTRVLTSSVVKEKGNMCRLTVVAESISFDTPPDEFDVQDIELNPEIQKHPQFQIIMGDGVSTLPFNTDANGNAVNPLYWTGAQILNFCQAASDGPSLSGRNENFAQLTLSKLNNDAAVLAAAIKLYQRFLKREETFYMNGFKVIWSQFFWSPPGVDAGGYIQDPITQGGLPEYFWSEDQTSSGINIFELSGINNPTIYNGGISWLRVADALTYQRTWFKLTRTWLGGPLGQWDKVIYPVFA